MTTKLIGLFEQKYTFAANMTKKTNSKVIAHLACFGAYLIFGFNIIICKGLSNSGLMSAQLLFCFRAIGASVLFWTLSLFLKREKVAGKDLFKIFLASIIGLYMTQMFFLEGIRHITPMDCTMLTTLSPIFTMFIAAIAIKEPITLKKAGGVALSFCGVLFLVYNSVHAEGNIRQTEPFGIVLILLNGLFWAAYLGIFRSLINRYSVVTFMKWMFLFSALVSVPFGFSEMLSVDYSAIPSLYIWELLYLILFSTFVAYFLIPVGQKQLRPTVVSLYGYVQPLLASVISVCNGMDTVTWQKLVAATAMIGGAVLVNLSRSRQTG